jgi:hypothetical protein
MPDTIDINISPVIETVDLTIQPNLTTINVNTITGGGGAVTSVNTQIGDVVLNQDNILDGTTNKQYSLTEKNKLAGIAAGAEVNVNADWNAVSGDAQILNKPSIPAAQVNSDWNATSGVAEILNKPTIPSLDGYVPYIGATNDVDLGDKYLIGRSLRISNSINDKFAVLQADNLTDNRGYQLPDENGTIALTSDIPSSSTFVPYTGATANVDLGTHKLLAKDLNINHTSGSGDAATITKGGSGEALKVVKTSGSGNAASITGGVTLLDELHLTTDLADAYISSAPTWNAKQNALSYTPYRNVQTSQTVHTGTTAETAIFTATIPANSFSSNDVIKVLFGANKTTALGTYSLRIRVNTTNTISGAPTIALYSGTSTAQVNIMMRNFNLNGGNLYAYPTGNSSLTDILATGGSLNSTTLNPANQFFIFATITLNNSGDSIIGNMFSIHN